MTNVVPFSRLHVKHAVGESLGDALCSARDECGVFGVFTHIRYVADSKMGCAPAVFFTFRVISVLIIACILYGITVFYWLKRVEGSLVGNWRP